MNLKELDEYRITDVIKFHNELNPDLFDGEHLRSEVRSALMSIADDFIDYLGLNNLQVKDIQLSGSNAAYSYTPTSDIDLHLIVDFSKLPEDEVYQELFTAKKTLYNDVHTIKVRGYDVELYVQDSGEKHHSLGEYSVKNNRWIKFPIRRRANLDQNSTLLKFKKLIQLSELALRSKNIQVVKKLLKKLKKYRQTGLDKHGEFGPENLAYKLLKHRGIVDQLYKHVNHLHSIELSLDEENQMEDYDPNGPPPGPEFKPTMPKGTVRVDVSDVYDWYKLGQHISNLKGLGKHDFGKGPPSTILSFGDENTEHAYIKDLEATGLSTTDIDPVDPNQPKGMKRQKVDPTFNVNESETKKIKVYHGNQGGINTERLFTPMWWTESMKDAIMYATQNDGDGHLLTATLEVNNPYIVSSGEETNSVLVDYKKLMRQGYDCIHDPSVGDWIPFNKSSLTNIVVKPVDHSDNITEEESSHKAIVLTNLPKYFKNGDSLEKFVPERSNVTYALHPDKYESTFYSLTNKDIDKLKFYRPKTIDIPAGTLVGDMAIANKFYRADNDLDRELYARLYKESLKPYPVDLNNYRMPELLIPKIISESASGYIPSNAERDDPRYKTGLTVDIKPDSIQKNASKLGLGKIKRTGIPPIARSDGKIK